MKDNNTSKEGDSNDGSRGLQKQDPKPLPKKTPEERNRDNVNMIAASQFAYTLVIGTCFFGFVGHWLGNKLGGAPWNAILMLLLGSLAFVGEMYRMFVMFSPKKEKKDESKDASKGGHSKTDGSGAKNVSGSQDPKDGAGSKNDLHDCGCSDDEDK
jgi:F0F1-type ATP synthase assembly protein I